MGRRKDRRRKIGRRKVREGRRGIRSCELQWWWVCFQSRGQGDMIFMERFRFEGHTHQSTPLGLWTKARGWDTGERGEVNKGRWITLHITAGPKHMLLEFPLHSKLVQSGEEQSGHDSRTSENLSAFKKTEITHGEITPFTHPTDLRPHLHPLWAQSPQTTALQTGNPCCGQMPCSQCP